MSKKITKDAIDRFYDYDINETLRLVWMGSIEANEEFVESGTNFSMAERVIKGLYILESQSKEPINIVMNNLGGDVYHGFAISDVIESCKSHVTITVYGYAMSMGSFILQAADKRVLSKRATMMIHYGQAGTSDHSLNFIKSAQEEQRLNKIVEDVYLEKIQEKNSHYSRQRLKNRMSFDWYLDAKQAIELGLADEILS